MDFVDFITNNIDWLICAGGILGFVGTVVGWRPVFNEEQMSTWVERYGLKRVRIVVAIVYLVLGFFGAVMALLG
ncbi:MAG TPA: hypothetical protein PKD09_21210 [Aggregatilinea sp.]|uniref:hypothetical protein n=1 Tax=Aggregatilinea sp. TaxID=2806333 RepID=UPI002C957859|nr:hypothetical protein [Aggregatilinea sp.]HML24187.1 hypothetical protein [Aggregatilinea sp.]